MPATLVKETCDLTFEKKIQHDCKLFFGPKVKPFINIKNKGTTHWEQHRFVMHGTCQTAQNFPVINYLDRHTRKAEVVCCALLEKQTTHTHASVCNEITSVSSDLIYVHGLQETGKPYL